MRLEPFIDTLRLCLRPDLLKATYFSTNPNFHGGWEVWLQSEIGYAFSTLGPETRILTREVPYPNRTGTNNFLGYNAVTHTVTVGVLANAAAKTDFLLQRIPGGLLDQTYVELKCLLAGTGLDDAWNRYRADVTKTRALKAANQDLNCIALLATFGTFDNIQRNLLSSEFQGAFVLDFRNLAGGSPRKSSVAQVDLGGAAGFFLVGFGV